MTGAGAPARARGTPLAMMGLVLAAWVGGRTVLWESPFPAPASLIPAALGPLIAERGAQPAPSAPLAPVLARTAVQAASAEMRAARVSGKRGSEGAFALSGGGFPAGMDPRYAAAHAFLWRTALTTGFAPRPARMAGLPGTLADALPGTLDGGDAEPPFLAAPRAPQRLGRWSVDAWGFWRQGSDAAPISQGRVPIYGASQIGALLQYRLRPDSGRDPRLYARAYRALVRRGESELALGASARPLARVPLRVFAELRVTDSFFGRQTRPSAFAVTEIAPLDLPLGTRLEAYAQGGWVGGADDTLFADGQASLTRDVEKVARLTDNKLRVSLGAGAWGGAQEDAQRIDLGPTMRFDMTLGQVPARVSVDWRERVEGDAGPGSGAAVTLSTRF